MAPRVLAQATLPTAAVSGQSNGTGSLTVALEPAADAATRRVTVTVTPDDSAAATAGTATVAGFPVIFGGKVGDVDWSVSGSNVSGKLVSADGKPVGTFAGTLSKTGLSGTFTTADGRVGLWSWEGPLPEQSAVGGRQ